MDEKKYPIYKYGLRFIHERQEEMNCESNGIGGYIMFKERLTAIEKGNFIHDKIEKLMKKYNSTNPIIKFTLNEMTFLKEDTWCLRWFNHYTFNSHLTDKELLRSFEEYVDRTSDEELMGAKDRWRWKGICRCKHCKKQGVVMIDH